MICEVSTMLHNIMALLLPAGRPGGGLAGAAVGLAPVAGAAVGLTPGTGALAPGAGAGLAPAGLPPGTGLGTAPGSVPGAGKVPVAAKRVGPTFGAWPRTMLI